MRPIAITADKKQKQLLITWNDAAATVTPIAFGLLSAMCPCELCTMERNDPNPLKIVRPHSDELEAITPVGNYAINIAWKDGCRFGIYTWERLSQLAHA
jgi:DUF971 family protein